MKNNSLFKITRFAWVFIMALAIVTTSCKKDDDNDDNPGDNPVIILDGVYVKGAGTALTDYVTAGKMSITRNEVVQEDRATLMDLYVAVKAGSDGFNIVTVDGGVPTMWGPGGDFAEVTELDGDEPTLGLWRGSLVETENTFTVPEDGLYHVAFDSEIGVVTVARVVWGVIGAATPGGWGASTQLGTSFDLESMTFTAADVVLTKGDFKFRYSNGWKVILDPDFDLGDGNTGIKVNSNYGGAVDALVPGGANIVNETPGKYSITVSWSLDGGTTATLEKTGDLETFDYSATELGLVGDGLVVNGNPHNWDETVMLSTPTITDETTYTWMFEGVEVSTAGSFKIREGQSWDNKVIGYPDVVMGGTAAADFETNGDGNFVPKVDGSYDFELIIDAVTEIYTVNVKAAGAADPEMYMLGDGCAAGWDNNAALALNGTGGVYTITADLTGGGYIKFITTLGQWAPMYGTDADGTATSGNLVYRETESDPDPASIPVDADGTYNITIDVNNLTYTIEAAAAAPELFMLGDGCSAGWDNNAALPMEGTGGVYTLTTDLIGNTEGIKFITTLGQWAPMYASDGTGDAFSGGLQFRETEADPDPTAIPVAADGTYTVTLDVNNLTYTVVAAK